MANSNTILDLMIGHHTLIEVLLTTLRDNLSQSVEVIEKSLSELQWELEKHIFVEETVIFKLCDDPNSKNCEIAQNLVKEHDKMLEMLNDLKEDLTEGKEVAVSEFQKLLTSHRETEERDLYPELDRELDKAQKESVIARINEIPLKQKQMLR